MRPCWVGLKKVSPGPVPALSGPDYELRAVNSDLLCNLCKKGGFLLVLGVDIGKLNAKFLWQGASLQP